MTAPAASTNGAAKPDVLPISAVVPTRNRAAFLRRTLESLAHQSAQPAEIILVDASEGDATAALAASPPASQSDADPFLGMWRDDAELLAVTDFGGMNIGIRPETRRSTGSGANTRGSGAG